MRIAQMYDVIHKNSDKEILIEGYKIKYTITLNVKRIDDMVEITYKMKNKTLIAELTSYEKFMELPEKDMGKYLGEIYRRIF